MDVEAISWKRWDQSTIVVVAS